MQPYPRQVCRFAALSSVDMRQWLASAEACEAEQTCLGVPQYLTDVAYVQSTHLCQAGFALERTWWAAPPWQPVGIHVVN